MGGSQAEFNFEGEGEENERGDAVAKWREERLARLREWAYRVGLPIETRVEVRLLCGQTFRGLLLPYEPDLFGKSRKDKDFVLIVDGVPFRMAEIDSCARCD